MTTRERALRFAQTDAVVPQTPSPIPGSFNRNLCCSLLARRRRAKLHTTANAVA